MKARIKKLKEEKQNEVDKNKTNTITNENRVSFINKVCMNEVLDDIGHESEVTNWRLEYFWMDSHALLNKLNEDNEVIRASSKHSIHNPLTRSLIEREKDDFIYYDQEDSIDIQSDSE
jgi:hypothetical protein